MTVQVASPTHARAVDLGLVACDTCDLVMRAGEISDDHHTLCPRCHEPIERRKPNGVTRAWAFLIAAAALYIPANTLVMMRTVQFPDRRSDTIWSGVQFLAQRGEWDLAILVFVASICVPMIKLVALAILLVSSQRGVTTGRRARTKLYRALEIIGHWSMLDVFVVALLTAVVQIGQFASVRPGPALLPFAGVVLLTMMASASFDPRSIWDPPPKSRTTSRAEVPRG